MDEHELKALHSEIEKLREDLAAMRLYANKHFDMFKEHLIQQDQEVGTLYAEIMELVRKFLPQRFGSRKHFDLILNRKSPTRFRRDPDDSEPDQS